jgi:LysM repeat protein
MRNSSNAPIFFLLALFLLQSYLLYGESYRVSQGDTLYSIAKKYQVSVKELMTLNRIDNPSSLSVGMDLVIPGTESSSPAEYYSVARGDTYYSISRKHNMTVEELLRLNNLSARDILSIGQRLAVSGGVAPTPADPESHRVQQTTDSQPTTVPVKSSEPTRATEPITSGPSLVYDKTGRNALTPEWPVAGSLYSVDGDFEGVMIESIASSYVEAISSGEVVWAGPYWEFGEIVLIENDGFIYFYGGNSDIFVNVGQNITLGTRLGRLENIDGRGKMYFTIFKEGKVIDLAMVKN